MLGDKWRRRRHVCTGALGFYFIRDAEKTECRAKMKGQTLQCLVNVCQFFSHVICGYDPLANTSTCRYSQLPQAHTFPSFSFFCRGGKLIRRWRLRPAALHQKHGDVNRWTPKLIFCNDNKPKLRPSQWPCSVSNPLPSIGWFQFIRLAKL